MRTTHATRVLNDPKAASGLKERIRAKLSQAGAFGTIPNTLDSLIKSIKRKINEDFPNRRLEEVRNQDETRLYLQFSPKELENYNDCISIRDEVSEKIWDQGFCSYQGHTVKSIGIARHNFGNGLELAVSILIKDDRDPIRALSKAA